MSAADNETLVRRYYDEIANRGEVAPDDMLSALLTPNFAFYPPNATMPQEGRPRHAQFLAWHHTTAPDQHFAIDEIDAGAGGRVVVLFTLRATQRGTFLGIPPTGKRFSVQGIDVFRIANGLISELRRYFDALTIAQQLGATLTPPAPS